MAADLRQGSELAGFRIESLLGRGGMGVVYRATQLSLERQVALKLISPELAHEERFRERFLREARLAASLEHPHLLPVHEVGEEEGTLFLAMRLVEGASLAEVLRREGRLAPERALRIFAQLCHALGAAHEAGLLHRDVKPQNVLLAGEGEREHAYLCDFGLSRRLSGGSLTGERAFLGTARYAAPEQIRGEELDERCDLYSLACLLYECLTGAPPFTAGDELALAWAHLHEAAPAPGSVDTALARFDGFFARALAKEPGERFASASELTEAAGRALAAETVAAPPAAPAPQLPRPLTSFLGRERELQELLGLLLKGEARLLTLTGPGGTGKTRLALRAAEEAATAFAEGVHWVGLAALRDPALVTETIAQTLGAKDGLAEQIGDKRLLLLLDNLEQVVEAAPELASLLGDCPNLSLLVTSRELLRVQGEREYPVPPLAEPEAIELFCARSGLEPSHEIAELCARLDNLPLAVELAAARTKALSTAQILERLSQRLDLLKGGRDADPRQQTLRAAIEWSYDLLSEEEQQLFACLSVFAGGCTLKAAEEVAEADLDTLQSLVEKSLLRFSNERYWMLETIREYASERLADAGELDAAMEEHAKWMLRLVAEVGSSRAIEARARERFAREQDNFRHALDWAAQEGHVGVQLALVGRSWLFWWDRGHSGEGLRWVDAALQRSGGQRTKERADVLAAGAMFAVRSGDQRRLKAHAEDSLAIARETGDASGHVWPLIFLGIWAAEEGDYAESQRFYEEAMTIAGETGHRELVGVAMNNLGVNAARQGDVERAAALYDDARVIARELGALEDFAMETLNLAECLRVLGRVDQAAEAAVEGLSLAREIESDRATLQGLQVVVGVLSRRGEEGSGVAQLVGAVAALRESLGEVSGDDVDLASVVVQLEATLGPHGFESAIRKGRALSLDAAVDAALASLS